jgi:hypothetical protein
MTGGPSGVETMEVDSIRLVPSGFVRVDGTSMDVSSGGVEGVEIGRVSPPEVILDGDVVLTDGTGDASIAGS